MSIKLVTLGCRLNAYESEVMRAHAEGAGLQNVIIVNSCAVTGEAERQTRQAIRRAKRDYPEAQVIVTGCAAQLDPAAFSAMPEVDRVLGNAEKLTAGAWQKTSTQKVLVADIADARETAGHLLSGFGGRTRAFLQVQQGCDHRCTFCIIPFGRGPSRSVPVGQVVEEARRLTQSGVKEIVLTGVDITDYGKDLPGKPSLGDLARRLLKLVPDLPRLRLSSLDPSEIDEATYDLLASEPRLMPHLHLSVQAGSDLILKRMKRRHLRADVLRAAERARRLRLDLVIGADFIAGFPTESDAAFEETMSLVEEVGITFLHVFPYSARRGTPAARMPQVPMAVRKERAARLRELGARQEAAFLASRIGQNAAVLIEDEGLGRSEHYAPVEIAGAPGSLIAARLTAVTGKHLIGVAA